MIHSVVSHDKTTGTIKIIVQAATNTEEFYAPIDVADTMVQVIKKFCNSAKNSYENQLLESVKCEVGLMNEEAPFNYFIFRLHATITEQTLPDLSALKIK